MSYKCPLNNEVAFKITISHIIDQMVSLKVISLFDGYLMDIYMTCRLTQK
jgi:hypothetical protein